MLALPVTVSRALDKGLAINKSQFAELGSRHLDSVALGEVITVCALASLWPT